MLSEVDPGINAKGLKINPKDVMMNYLSTPNRVLKTVQQSLVFINNSKISESKCYIEILCTSYSIFLNISVEYLGLSKLLYYYLLNIFEYCGLTGNNPDNDREIFDLEKQNIQSMRCSIEPVKELSSGHKSARSFTALFRPTSFETDMGVLLTRRHIDQEKPQIRIISEDDTASEGPNDAFQPRLSQKYLADKGPSYRSQSVAALKQRRKIST